MHRVLATSVVSLLVLSSSARANEAGSSDAPAMKRLTVTWSPIHLVLPLVELTAEYVVAPNIGVAVIAGAGRVSDDTAGISATAYEAGAQFNYYVLRPASGLHVGVEALYLSLGDVEQDDSLTGSGLGIGPYAGYKLVTSIGFTFVAQLGVVYQAVKASSTTQTAEDSNIGPLLNLNVGWSF